LQNGAVAERDDERIKLCRYCDGLVEWGTEVCPHCGESLEIVKFDDMDFVDGSQSAWHGQHLKKSDEPPRPPVIEPIPDKKGPPVLKPIGGKKDPPVIQPIGEENGPPVAKPIGKKKGPTITRTGKISDRGRRGAPPKRRASAPPPVVKPVDASPPVIEPIDDGPPVMKPMPPPGPAKRKPKPPVIQPIDPDLPAGIDEYLECPVCAVEMEGPEEIGGQCRNCGQEVCLTCLMRANGVRAAATLKKNRARWAEHVAAVSADKIRCPACGRKGID
jgi:ssDNA-binding Zn-finger/Zn-ribbon topoisomerase 1